MFVLQQLVPIDHADELGADTGYVGQTAIDNQTGDTWVKLAGGWAKVRDGSGQPVSPPVDGAVTVQNADGSVTRALTAQNGIVTLAATDAIVANGGTLSVENSAGADPKAASVSVAGGLVTAAKLPATTAMLDNGAAVAVFNSAGADSHNGTATIVNGAISSIKLPITVAMVDNGDTFPLQDSAGTVSTTATLNSPATAIVATGVLAAVKAAA